MARYARNPNTYYRNEAPITDLNEALYVLSNERFGRSSRDSLHLRNETVLGNRVWEVVFPWYREGSSGGDTWGQDYFLIADEVAAALIAEHLVAPLRILHMGYTETDEKRLVLSEHGKERLAEFEMQMQAEAQSMLIPGVHTDLSLKLEHAGWGRDGYQCGRFYADFKTPNEDIVRVYPEQNELVYPYPPKKQKIA